MSLVDHAKEELNRAGLFDKNSDYDGMLGNAVLELVEVFAKQGHSGFSANCCLDIFNKVARFKVLSPITNDSSEWMEVSSYYPPNHPSVHQSRRDCSLFSNDGGKSFYSVDDPKREIKFSKECVNSLNGNL